MACSCVFYTGRAYIKNHRNRLFAFACPVLITSQITTQETFYPNIIQ